MGDRELVPGAVYLEHGQPVTVLAAWKGRGPRNVAIQRSDGTRGRAALAGSAEDEGA